MRPSRNPLSRIIATPGLARVALAGPGAVVTTLLTVLGMSVWLPPGQGQVNQLAFPLVLLPLIWAILFFHACLDRSLRRAALVALALCTVNAGLVAYQVTRPPMASPTESAR